MSNIKSSIGRGFEAVTNASSFVGNVMYEMFVFKNESGYLSNFVPTIAWTGVAVGGLMFFVAPKAISTVSGFFATPPVETAILAKTADGKELTLKCYDQSAPARPAHFEDKGSGPFVCTVK